MFTKETGGIKVFATKEQCEQKTKTNCIYYLCDIPIGDLYQKLCTRGHGSGWYSSSEIGNSQNTQPTPSQNSKETENWKVFSNRSGWSVKYPTDWKISSCQSCSDPTDPKVFVDFFPPTTNSSDEGWVQISRVVDKPANKNVDEWLTSLKSTLNLNPILKEEKITINNLPALKVRYRNPYAGGQESETVYVVSGSETFTVAFSGNKAGVILENFGNYNVYVQMLSTFNVSH